MSSIRQGHPEAREKLTARLFWRQRSGSDGYEDAGNVREYSDGSSRSLVTRHKASRGARLVNDEQADTCAEVFTFLLDEQVPEQSRLMRLVKQSGATEQRDQEGATATLAGVYAGRWYDLGAYNVANVSASGTVSGTLVAGTDYHVDQQNGRLLVGRESGIDGEDLLVTFDQPGLSLETQTSQRNAGFFCDVILEEHNQYSEMWLRRLTFEACLNMLEMPVQAGEFAASRLKVTVTSRPAIEKRPEGETLPSMPEDDGAGRSSSSSQSSPSTSSSEEFSYSSSSSYSTMSSSSTARYTTSSGDSSYSSLSSSSVTFTSASSGSSSSSSYSSLSSSSGGESSSSSSTSSSSSLSSSSTAASETSSSSTASSQSSSSSSSSSTLASETSSGDSSYSSQSSSSSSSSPSSSLSSLSSDTSRSSQSISSSSSSSSTSQSSTSLSSSSSGDDVEYQAVNRYIQLGGHDYTVGDVLTLVGGTYTVPVEMLVTAVEPGAQGVYAVDITNPGNYTHVPGAYAGVTGGTGSGAAFNFDWEAI